MMKMLYNKQILSAIALLAVMIILGGCIDHIEENMYSPDENVSFKTSWIGNGTTLPTKGSTGTLDFVEEEWIVDFNDESTTKADLINSLNGLDAGVYGYVYSGDWSESNVPFKDINGDIYTFDGDMLNTNNPVRWSVVEKEASDGSKFKALVYAPKDAVTPSYQAEAKGAPVISVDVRSLQKDIIVADKEVTMNLSTKAHRKEIPLEFEHIFTALQFKAGFDCIIKSISIKGIHITGKYIIGSGWVFDDALSSYVLTLPGDGLHVANGDLIGVPMLMIPQKFGSEAEMSLTYTANGTSKTVTADLNGAEWRQGKKITYTLIREEDREYIYLDLAAGAINITGNSYKGCVFVKTNDEIEAKTIEGTNTTGKKYYIYQSCVTDHIKNHSEEKFKRNYKSYFTSYTATDGSGTFTLPVYEPVKVSDGRLWSDYITNNDNVEAVIEAWDDAKGANNNEFNESKAVRKVGREATKNMISISGSVGDCTVIIDNIYCSKQHQGANRTYGSISYVPTWNSNSHLYLHLIGDNRLGSLHYNNNTGSGKGSNDIRKGNTNKLIIEGEGSLTVADADFYTYNGGYYSNHYDSAIGNADNINSTYGIVINSGTVFAGTTEAENSSAIGAGGNGYGDVVINGGVVTAVASTTGTAIGGGIGYSDTGGQGYVEINGGNVYAYNHKHRSNIPSSAIGGAGSSAQGGSQGTVVITGGYVYAQSALGTAIGGGSSQTKTGGYGSVTITGGMVIAKSLSSISAGIGGGSTCTGGGSIDKPNGGNAIVTVGDKNDPSKNPIVRTGSIGGGGTKANGGTVGNAQIHIYGGDIQAQFVMAKSSGNIFEMAGGLVRNSSTSDNTYYCIKEHGGAVYMEQGTFTMSGGIIKECYADKTESAKGGAVYIKGDSETSFTMTGGEIRECRANADGGAVYLESGSVTISGGIIDGNVAYNGNGGAISILGGSFTMNGESASISKNAAFDRGSGLNGNGGGIYIAPALNSNSSISVDLKKGKILANSSDRYGGGVCVDMGSNAKADLSVIVGEKSDKSATDVLKIAENNALIKGGGMYIKGANATVTLNDGYVLDNQTSSYQVNPDMTVEGGLVTLMKPGITTQVTVTFNNNAQYYTQNDPTGQKEDIMTEQYIVAASLSELKACTFAAINEYYKNFKGWNTRRDGKGASYTDSQIVSLDENITLYAQWSDK